MSRRESGVSGDITVSVKLERGNSELTEIDLDPSVVWRRGRSQVFSINNLSFVEGDGGNIVNEGFSHARYNFTWQPWLVYEVFVQAQYNEAQDLSERYLAGTGLRFLTVTRENFALSVGVLGMFEHETLDDGERTDLVRNSDYLSMRFARSGRYEVSSTTYYQPAVEDLGDFRVLSEARLTVWLSTWFGLTGEVRYRYDSDPPEGIREYDIEIKNGLTLTF